MSGRLTVMSSPRPGANRERNRALTAAAKTYLDQATGTGFTVEEALEAVQSVIGQHLPRVNRDQESSSGRII